MLFSSLPKYHQLPSRPFSSSAYRSSLVCLTFDCRAEWGQAYPINQATDGELRPMKLENWNPFFLTPKIYVLYPKARLIERCLYADMFYKWWLWSVCVCVCVYVLLCVYTAEPSTESKYFSRHVFKMSFVKHTSVF